jgi:hypothetical protein
MRTMCGEVFLWDGVVEHKLPRNSATVYLLAMQPATTGTSTRRVCGGTNLCLPVENQTQQINKSRHRYSS